MKCIICKRTIYAGHSLKIWVENANGSLVKLPHHWNQEAAAHVCASVSGRKNVCRDAINQGRTYLNDDEVAERDPKTSEITEVVY